MDNFPERIANVIMVRGTNGFDLATDGATDRPTFSVQFRAGGTAPGRTAEEMGLWFDNLWMRAGAFFLGDYWVVGTFGVSRPPAYALTDDSQRVYRAAAYGCEIEY